MTRDDLMAALTKGVSADANLSTLKELVGAVAEPTNTRDKGLLQAFSDRLGKADSSKENDCAVNILAAGFFGLLPGGDSLRPLADPTFEYRVNPFLHRLRLAILAEKSLDAGRKDNGKTYAFYPEFKIPDLNSIRNRVVAVARAHAEMDAEDRPGKKDKENDYLKVLYSLGGYFGEKEAAKWVEITGNGGTTCIMSARGVYHAAGLAMIGERPPTLNTPDGMHVELGVPKRKEKIKPGEKDGVPTVNRADQTTPEYSKTHKYDERNEQDPPHLFPGDIYWVSGHDGYLYLMRGAPVTSDHVGIVVAKAGRVFDTVDGGNGSGAKTAWQRGRQLTYVKDVGWTFPNSTNICFSANVAEANRWANELPDSSLAGLIEVDSSYDTIKKDYMKNKTDLEMATAKGDMARVSQLQAARKGLLERARKLARQQRAGKYAAYRSIQGWWRPEQYQDLTYVDRASLRKLVQERQRTAA